MKPILTFLILLFFLGPPMQCTPCVLSCHGIIYVDDDGGADFSKIQDAINASSEGDTVYVYSGLYQENIVVDKSILLQGENKDSTIIDGNLGSNVVRISANWTTITGFKIQNGFYGIMIEDSSDNSITDNIISNNQAIGIFLVYSSDNLITDNSFQSDGITIYGNKIEHWTSHIMENNTANGRPIRYYKNMNIIIVPNDTAQVILANCTGCTIQNLQLSHVDIGLQLGFSSDNTIMGNTISDNQYAGIRLWNSSDNTILGSTIADNQGSGLFLSFSSDNNTITGNTITTNHDIGIYLYDSSDNNTITGNTITTNHGTGICLYHSSDKTSITGNNISNNSDDGITIVDSELNFISSNNVTNNKISGIEIIYSHNNSIIDNHFTKNDCGIRLVSGSLNNTIRYNNFLDNFEGIAITGSCNNTLFFNYCYDNNHGIFLSNANNNELTGNIFENGMVGIRLYESSRNHVQQNTLSHNQQGIVCSYAPDNIITKNNLISNEEQAKVSTFFNKGFLIPNTWRGNYWDDWKGLCVKCIPGILYVPTKNLIGIFLPWVEVDWHPSRTPYER